ncbi:MAG TPA: YceI family protein, partial [Halomonas sp.]|nr:YceI family protein [Halomonas sp.]
MFKKTAIAAALSATALVGVSQAQAADYAIDTEGQHAFIQFKISHLGFSYLLGSFEEFSGSFQYDPENLESASAQLEVQVASLNSNHAERDKHIKGSDFLNVGEYPTATFSSTG